MWEKFGLAATFIIFLSGCTIHHENIPDHHPTSRCMDIKRQLHLGGHRHNAGRRLTAIHRAHLIKEYYAYGCE